MQRAVASNNQKSKSATRCGDSPTRPLRQRADFYADANLIHSFKVSLKDRFTVGKLVSRIRRSRMVRRMLLPRSIDSQIEGDSALKGPKKSRERNVIDMRLIVERAECRQIQRFDKKSARKIRE